MSGKWKKRIADGDEYAELVYNAMIYKLAKCIGGLATAVDGEIDGIVVTGGIAHSKMFIEKLEKRVKFIHPLVVIPGEYEMEALAAGITRVLNGEETARIYKEDEKLR